MDCERKRHDGIKNKIHSSVLFKHYAPDSFCCFAGQLESSKSSFARCAPFATCDCLSHVKYLPILQAHRLTGPVSRREGKRKSCQSYMSQSQTTGSGKSLEQQTFGSPRPNSSSRSLWGTRENMAIERDIDIVVGGSIFIGDVVVGDVVGRREGVDGALVVMGVLVAIGAA